MNWTRCDEGILRGSGIKLVKIYLDQVVVVGLSKQREAE